MSSLPIKALIVDDEQSSRNVLRALLGRSAIAIEVLGECEDVPQAVDFIKANPPDVVFLDVEMPNYAGYELIRFFDQIHFKIIFITAYDQYAIKAFELNAVDYLLKPINRLRLGEALTKLSARLAQEAAIEEYNGLLQSLQSKKQQNIVIPELTGKRIFALDNIVAIEGEGAYCNVYLADNECVTVSRNLKFFETALEGEESFFRAHKSWIINKLHIKQYSTTNLSIELKGKITAKLSKNKKNEFEDFL